MTTASKGILATARGALKGLLSSKKVSVTVLGLLVQLLVLLATKAGLDHDTALAVSTNCGILFLSWLGAQGLADAGKGTVTPLDPSASWFDLVKAMVRQLLASKKFLTLVAGVAATAIAALGAKFGFAAEDASELAMKLTVGAAGLLGVQGVTDVGKEKVKAEMEKVLGS